MAGETVAERRAGYYGLGGLPEDFPAWNKRTFRNRSGVIRVSGPGTLGGIVVVRGATDARVIAYDRDSAIGTLKDDEIAAPVGVTGSAKAFDGFVNMPIKMERGIVIDIDVADAIVTVYFI